MQVQIALLDVLPRNEDLQQKLAASTELDLIMCDEAHQMSASYLATTSNTRNATTLVGTSVGCVITRQGGGRIG